LNVISFQYCNALDTFQATMSQEESLNRMREQMDYQQRMHNMQAQQSHLQQQSQMQQMWQQQHQQSHYGMTCQPTVSMPTNVPFYGQGPTTTVLVPCALDSAVYYTATPTINGYSQAMYTVPPSSGHAFPQPIMYSMAPPSATAGYAWNEESLSSLMESAPCMIMPPQVDHGCSSQVTTPSSPMTTTPPALIRIKPSSSSSSSTRSSLGKKVNSPTSIATTLMSSSDGKNKQRVAQKHSYPITAVSSGELPQSFKHHHHRPTAIPTQDRPRVLQQQQEQTQQKRSRNAVARAMIPLEINDATCNKSNREGAGKLTRMKDDQDDSLKSEDSDSNTESESNVENDPRSHCDNEEISVDDCNEHADPKNTAHKTTFPQKLHRMILDCEEHGLSDVVSFGDSGKAFVIHDGTRFEKEVLGQYFGRNVRFGSFKRLLFLYGFRFAHHKKSDAQRYYYHPYFQRDLDTLHRVRKSERRAVQLSVLMATHQSRSVPQQNDLVE
jgi:hypothetical protein